MSIDFFVVPTVRFLAYCLFGWLSHIIGAGLFTLMPRRVRPPRGSPVRLLNVLLRYGTKVTATGPG
jgi:hypothetical protein